MKDNHSTWMLMFAVLVSLFSIYNLEKIGAQLFDIIENKSNRLDKLNKIQAKALKIKIEADSLHQRMNRNKIKLNTRIENSVKLSNEINSIFTDSLLDISLADSLDSLYTYTINLNEFRTDSLNHLFIDLSDDLIKQLVKFQKYANKGQSINNSITLMRFKIIFYSSLFLIYIFILSICVRYLLNTKRNN